MSEPQPDQRLDPIWDLLSEDVEKYEALAESKKIKFGNCKHKKAKIVDNMLRCPCGAAWSGIRLEELQEALAKRK